MRAAPALLRYMRGAGAPEPAAPVALAISFVAAALGVPLDVAAAVAQAESAFDPLKPGAAGDRGLYQVTPIAAAEVARISPAAAELLAADPSLEWLFDPWVGSCVGLRYLCHVAAIRLGTAKSGARGTWDIVETYARYNGGGKPPPVSYRRGVKVASLAADLRGYFASLGVRLWPANG